MLNNEHNESEKLERQVVQIMQMIGVRGVGVLPSFTCSPASRGLVCIYSINSINKSCLSICKCIYMSIFDIN